METSSVVAWCSSASARVNVRKSLWVLSPGLCADLTALPAPLPLCCCNTTLTKEDSVLPTTHPEKKLRMLVSIFFSFLRKSRCYNVL